MTRRAAAAVCVLLACAQTREVGKPQAGAKDDTARAAGEPAPKRKKAVQAAPGRPPVPASPQALLQEGGARRIQEALAAKGYLQGAKGDELDAATAAALRRFQGEEGLAATGFPDRETLRRLDLDPQTVYRTEEKAAAEREQARERAR